MNLIVQLAVQLSVFAAYASIMQTQSTAHLLLNEREVVAPVGVETKARAFPFETVAHGFAQRTTMLFVERSDLPVCAVGDRDLRLMGLLVQRDEFAYTVCCQQYGHEIIGLKIEVLRIAFDVMVADGVQPSQANGLSGYSPWDHKALDTTEQLSNNKNVASCCFHN